MIQINKRKIGKEYPPFIVAELSANHCGSIETAFKALKSAKDAGVDAVKIQTYNADAMTIDCDLSDFMLSGTNWGGGKIYDLYRQAGTPYDWHEQLYKFAGSIDLTLFSTPFNEYGVDLLESLNNPIYKVASFEIVDIPLIKYIASKKKPMIISTGMATKNEIEEAINAAREGGCNELIILHCVSSYPTSLEHANLSKIKTLAESFNILTGLSDHTLGTASSIASVAFGACVIEKHFTLSRELKSPDSAFSIEPDELSILCRDSYAAWQSIGNGGWERHNDEKENLQFRRSIYIVKDLKKGEKISSDNIKRIRPGYGLSPKFLDQVLGRTLKKDVSRGTPLSWEIIE